MWRDRTKLLVGDDGIEKLAHSHVAIIGIGGVGGYAAMMLARAGIGKLTLVDFDLVSEANINRQVVADTTTIGRHKTLVMKEMIEKINPKAQIYAKQERVTEENLAEVLEGKYDYVIDAIDSVKDKVSLICYCKNNNLNIISAMGAGNRIDIPEFKVKDIYKTSHDGLAKVMRKQLREKNVAALEVVTSESLPQHTGGTEIGSISYYPAMCGCVLCAYVVNKLIKK